MCLKNIKLSFVYLILKLIIFKSANANQNLEPIEIVIKSENNETTLISGTKERDWLGGEYFAFRGIPYAEPPIGELRFKDTVELKTLPTYVDARYDGHDCPSVSATNASENCLNINVYTKHKMPVLCFIHPGGLYLDSALSTFIDASYLLTKPMVLVTFNYRLATLGFLGLGTKEIPGNAGFKDQVYALRWLKRFIVNFGGNPNDVTLMGYSAGGLSVALHLASPMSRGLFQKAIIMSGILPPQTILPQDAHIELAIRQAEKLNCSNLHNENEINRVDTAKILHCLNNFSGAEIAATLRSMFIFGKDTPLYLWLPVKELDFGQARFLAEDFYELIKNGDFARVPLLIGSTDGEFGSIAANILNDENLKKTFHAEFARLAPFLFMYQSAKNASYITDSIEQHYKDVTTDDWVFEDLSNAISAALIYFGAHRLSTLAAKYVDVYNYKFVYRGVFSHFNYKVDKPRAEHLDDLMYLFGMSKHKIQPTDNDAKIVDLYTNFIWDFVTNGKISTNSLNFPKSYTLINETLIPQNGTNFDEAAFWDELFP